MSRTTSPRAPRRRSLLPVAALSLTWLALGPEPRAAEPSPRPATWDMSVEELQAIGLGQYRGDPVPVPADAPLPPEGAPIEPQAGGAAGVIFVNFDGAQLSSGYDSSHDNVTQIGQLAGSFSAYGEGAKRDAVLQAVIEDWAPFNVLITDTRPANGDYTMNMTGPTNPFGGGVLGIAPLDCNDQQTHNNITFAFHSVNDSFSAAVTATTIGQEVAHSYGLEHVDEPGDIMNPYNAGGDAIFIDDCIPIVQSVSCGNQHNAVCGQSTLQNSYQELMNLFGPGVPDGAPPAVQIVSPQNGDVFEVGASFTISVEANDDVGVQQLLLYNNGEHIQTDSSEPWGWDVSNAPEGTYELYAEASDLAGNVSMSNVVTVSVGAAPPAGSDEGGADDGGADDGGAADDGSVDGDDGAADAGAGDDSADDGAGEGGADDGVFDGEDNSLPGGFGQDRGGAQGCACTTAARNGVGAMNGGVGGSGWAALSLLVLGATSLRRRRPHA
jgi:hypothetical protein